jgi:hypothetical protein
MFPPPAVTIVHSTFFLAILCVGTTGWVVRNVPSESLPPRCLKRRDDIPCRSELRAALVSIRNSNSLSVRSFLPKDASCLRNELLDVQKSLHVSTCVFDQFIAWNHVEQVGSIRDHESFVHLVEKCAIFNEDACQIHIWYEYVFSRNIGKPVESLGLNPTSIRSINAKVGVPVWAPSVSIGRAIIDFQLERIPPKRRFEDIESDDSWIDVLTEHFGGQQVAILMPNGRLEDPPLACSKTRMLTCKADYEMALQFMRGIGEVPGVQSVMVELLFEVSNKPLYSCIYRALSKFRKSLLLDTRSYNHLLTLNSGNVPISAGEFEQSLGDQPARSRCDLHLWYHYVINPNLGRTVSSIGVHEVGDGSGRVVAPPRQALLELIDFELSRLGLVELFL